MTIGTILTVCSAVVALACIVALIATAVRFPQRRQKILDQLELPEGR